MTTIGVFACIFDEQNHILCAKRNYPPYTWSNPGGRMEPNENPVDALIREVREETGNQVEISDFIGIYSAPIKDDLVLSFEARIIKRDENWVSDGEISEFDFYSRETLPQPMKERTRQRLLDAFEKQRGTIRIFQPEESD